jgi:hypothetical protein
VELRWCYSSNYSSLSKVKTFFSTKIGNHFNMFDSSHIKSGQGHRTTSLISPPISSNVCFHYSISLLAPQNSIQGTFASMNYNCFSSFNVNENNQSRLILFFSLSFYRFQFQYISLIFVLSTFFFTSSIIGCHLL